MTSPTAENPEPDGFPAQTPPGDTWEVLASPAQQWPLARSGAAPDPAPAPRPTRQQSYAALEAADAARNQRFWPIDVTRTLWFELRRTRGAEPAGLVSGGALGAVGLLTALVALLLFGVAGALGSWGAEAFTAVVLAVVSLTTMVVGYARFRREDLGGRS